MTGYFLLEEADTTALQAELFHDGDSGMQILPAASYLKYGRTSILNMMIARGIYVCPTLELVEYFREQIGNMRAIEVGAGHGSIARALQIPAIDCDMQRLYKDKYKAMKQPMTAIPPDVIKVDANQAVSGYKPECVIGCYITQRWQEGMTKGLKGGINEIKMMDVASKYIHVGSTSVHEGKLIDAAQHIKSEVIGPLPWLLVRSAEPDTGRIWTYTREEDS